VLVAVVCAAVACDSPDIAILGKRVDLTQELFITVCPTGAPIDSPDCAEGSDLFAGTSDYQRTADVLIGDNSGSVYVYLQTPNVNCVDVAITLMGEIHVDFTVGSDIAFCSPTAACVSGQIGDDTCD
jgi:hypothetical protein